MASSVTWPRVASVGDRDVAQAGARSGQLGISIHRRQAILRDIGGVGHGDQGAQLGLGAQTHGPPVQAAEVAREGDVLAGQQRRGRGRPAQGFPAQGVQFGCVGADRQADVQRGVGRLGRGDGFVEA